MWDFSCPQKQDKHTWRKNKGQQGTKKTWRKQKNKPKTSPNPADQVTKDWYAEVMPNKEPMDKLMMPILSLLNIKAPMGLWSDSPLNFKVFLDINL